jgi:hypothetical protein
MYVAMCLVWWREAEVSILRDGREGGGVNSSAVASASGVGWARRRRVRHRVRKERETVWERDARGALLARSGDRVVRWRVVAIDQHHRPWSELAWSALSGAAVRASAGARGPSLPARPGYIYRLRRARLRVAHARAVQLLVH